MADLALYRKYRPQAFKDVLGQEHVVKALQGAIKEGNVAHAYLFSGSRGTGKTSMARILAKALSVSDKDLYEMDAASNRGVDDVRALREGVATLPFESPYKVYVVDEAHMLTKEAFNALLKTLEEPPKHVIFVLATTEEEKLPETIVSRCQTFRFRKPSHKTLIELAKSVAKKEGFELESAAADLLALLGDGSFRDTHGMLQKVLSAVSGKKVSVADVEEIAGAPRGSLVNDLLAALAAGDSDAALAIVEKASAANLDMRTFLKLLLHRFRAALLMRHAPAMREVLAEEFLAEDAAFLSTLAKDERSKLTPALLKSLLEAYDLTHRAAVPELPLELAVLSAFPKEA